MINARLVTVKYIIRILVRDYVCVMLVTNRYKNIFGSNTHARPTCTQRRVVSCSWLKLLSQNVAHSPQPYYHNVYPRYAYCFLDFYFLFVIIFAIIPYYNYEFWKLIFNRATTTKTELVIFMLIFWWNKYRYFRGDPIVTKSGYKDGIPKKQRSTLKIYRYGKRHFYVY